MDLILQNAVWLIISVGVIGAYGMSLIKMMTLARGENGVDYSKFINPGIINMIGYSITGFMWGLELRRLLGREGPIININMSWKNYPVNSAIITTEFLIVWFLLGFLLL